VVAAARSGAYRSRVIVGVGLGALALLVAGLMVVMRADGNANWSAVVVGPVLMILSLPVLAREAAREDDHRLFWFLVIALAVKLLGAIIRYFVASGLYGQASDAVGYHQAGIDWAGHLRAGDFSRNSESLIGTNFIELVNGIVYTIIGPSLLSSFLVFSWLGFWGLFFFYRAFKLAVPEGRAWTYAKLLFFLPSLVFWPSGVGKEAWMMFALGIASFGVATILARSLMRGLLIAVPAAWLAGMVRPHVAALIGISVLIAYVVRRPRRDLRELAPFARVLSILILGLVAVVFVSRMNAYLQESNIETRGGVVSALDQVGARTAQGGSEFTPSVVDSPVRAPVAALTVLFRPLIPEANSAQTLVAAIEGTFLLGLSVVRIRWLAAAVRSVRRQPFVMYALAYVAFFVITFSSIANFGILTRQRVQVLPFYLILLAVPPMIHQGEANRRGRQALQPLVRDS
jgi:hypothetical protein